MRPKRLRRIFEQNPEPRQKGLRTIKNGRIGSWTHERLERGSVVAPGR